MLNEIPVIDLFAGPGGLGEGFSAVKKNGVHPFRISVSVEKDLHAHKTLSLRAFYRWFLHEGIEVPKDYYRHLTGEITLDELFEGYPNAYASVKKEALCAELGNPEEHHQPMVDKAIKAALKGQKDWLLIGGPPCQAYSLVGRSRMQNAADYRNKRGYDFTEDHRHQLYQQYLRIIAMHKPSVFVMENVKGILSSKLDDELIFPRILEDLRNPYEAGKLYGWKGIKRGQYHVISFVTGDEPEHLRDYLIRAEEYGVPQARHRVILLGIRDDIWGVVKNYDLRLKKDNPVWVKHMIRNMPHLRSGFSKGKFTKARWVQYFSAIRKQGWVQSLDPSLSKAIIAACKKLETGILERKHDEPGAYLPEKHSDWFADKELKFLPNHETRSHMDSDLGRYLFVSAYGAENGSSPRIKDFPPELLPAHKNVDLTNKDQKFADRFKVQRWNHPASTITSHISKDGHYFIHPDPAQCRSLTVREAARLQTFPDNYFFEGGRTQQYHQVGNAVPPLLAKQLAEIVYKIFKDANNDA